MTRATDSSRPVAAAALAIPDLSALIFSAYCSGNHLRHVTARSQTSGTAKHEGSSMANLMFRSTEPPLEILRLPQASKVTGLCRSMIYQLKAEKRFVVGRSYLIALGMRKLQFDQVGVIALLI